MIDRMPASALQSAKRRLTTKPALRFAPLLAASRVSSSCRIWTAPPGRTPFIDDRLEPIVEGLANSPKSDTNVEMAGKRASRL